MKKALLLWAPVGAWCGLIFALSHVPNLGTGWGLWDMLLRKSAHFTEYGVLAVLFWRALSGSTPLRLNAVFGCTLLFCVLYAATDEWHQGFVYGRHAAFSDVLIDSAGALALCLLQARMEIDAFTFLRCRFRA